jgi:hypothetical protein
MGCGSSGGGATSAKVAVTNSTTKAQDIAHPCDRAGFIKLVCVANTLDHAGGALVGGSGPEALLKTYPRRKPVYEKAEKLICLAHGWMQHTRQLRYLQLFDGMLAKSPELKAFCHDKACAKSAVAFCRSLAQASTQDITGFCHGYGNAYKQSHLALACTIMAAHETGDGIIAVFERVGDRMHRCESARKQAYNLMVQHAALILEMQQLRKSPGGGEQPDLVRDVSTRSLSNFHGAKRRIYDCIEEYLDQHKEQAFFSAVHEPARLVHILNNDHGGRDHVEVHALNGFLTLLRGGLGVQMPRIPDDDDQYWEMASVGFWDTHFLTDAAWEAFSKPEHFGLVVEGIKDLQHPNKGKLIGSQASRRSLGPPRGIEDRAKQGDISLAVYMEKYAYFFRRDFLVRRMFEILHSESKPEHMGFKKAFETVFQTYRQDAGIATESYVEHFYDEYIMHLDVDELTKMFEWLGILKSSNKTCSNRTYLK